ncbi:MAG: hypothetical protein K2F81_07650 [Ruminococcus sp.]|nr:hypothetical protein [Ruminococcus sp.]
MNSVQCHLLLFSRLYHCLPIAGAVSAVQIRACPFSTWQGQLQLTFLVGDSTPTKNIMAPAATPIRKDRLEVGGHLA